MSASAGSGSGLSVIQCAAGLEHFKLTGEVPVDCQPLDAGAFGDGAYRRLTRPHLLMQLHRSFDDFEARRIPGLGPVPHHISALTAHSVNICVHLIVDKRVDLRLSPISQNTSVSSNGDVT